MARDEDVYSKGQVARGGKGEGVREGDGECEHAAAAAFTILTGGYC